METVASTGLWITRSPLSTLFPGALMLVSYQHVQDITDLFPSRLNLVWQDLLNAERSLRAVTGCDRVNLVKFANENKHLHWHAIPRYREENFPKWNPWQIQAQKEAHVTLPQQISLASSGLYLKTETLYARIHDTFLSKHAQRAPGHYGACLILRPSDPEKRSLWAQKPVLEIMKEARCEPQSWDSLLMRQSYGRREWDHFGGNAEPNEFPHVTARRELQEEAGWTASEQVEVCRQWDNGILKGFLYCVKPNLLEGQQEEYWWMKDQPALRACDEVMDARYFNLTELLKDEGHLGLTPALRGRHLAFVNGHSDFHNPT
jgi:diadenosine tetraphosphate (Ap4A) HIT family hydrolase/8-oxo-dGTP pyrophosphatase MutT (NUDIX family)